MKRPLFSIIISTKNEANNINRLLLSINRQTYINIETLIVDNFSSDLTLKMAKKFKVKIFSAGNERSSQRNFGAQKAKGKYLVFLDADMELPPQIISEVYKKIDRPNIIATILPETVPKFGYFTRIKRLEKRLYLNDSIIEAPRVFLKKTFLKIGGYNSSLVAGEDWDIAERISSLGHITRIKTCILHYEVSLIIELKHKWYYARLIKNYAKLYPASFKLQSGVHRLDIFLKKWRELLLDPFATCGLLLLKLVELGLFMLASFEF